MIMLDLYECLDHSWSKGCFPVVHLFPFSVLRDNSEYEFKLLANMILIVLLFSDWTDFMESG